MAKGGTTTLHYSNRAESRRTHEKCQIAKLKTHMKEDL